MECSCCGMVRDPPLVSSLQCNDAINICRMCAQWLVTRTGGIDVTPTLPVADLARAVSYWEGAGFEVNRYDEGFAFVSTGEQSVFDLDLVEGFDPAANRGGCYIITDQTEAWHARFVAAGMDVTSVEDMPWGMREFALTDPDGNRIRIGRSTPNAND